MPVFRVPANITWTGPGSPGVNVWSIRTAEASVVVDELELALDALEAFYTAIKTQYPTGTVITLGPDIVDRESAEDQSRPQRQVFSGTTSGKAPAAVQVCVSWRTSLRARRGMGRTFIGPLVQDLSSSSDGTPTSTMITAVSTAAQGLLTASDNATGWAVGVWGLESPGSYDGNGNLIPGQPHVHRDITAFKIRDQFAVLRSRRD